MASAEERRRQKELEEARKAGLAPAELDEDGKEINPHIPQYMTSAPWYLNKDHPTLQHQRNWNQKEEDTKWYDRGAKVFQATKFRKGACENCGSMSHTTKDCLERPRAKGAKYTGKNIAADDKVEQLGPKSFDAKRDRWNGYDAKDYSQVMDRFEQLDQLRREIKAKQQVDQMYTGEGEAKADGEKKEGAEGAAEDDEARLQDEENAGFAEVKKRVNTTAGGSTGSVRNLRIREDTAKYLLNLDVNSAHYDPKTRSMREDPQPDKPMNEKTFAGDNFVRKSGDYAAWQSLQLHSMQAFEKGTEVHVMANPSLAEMMYKQYKEKKEKLQGQSKEDVAAKYGDAAAPKPEDLALLGATDRYVEYDRHGRVVKGQETKARSRYEEDVYLNNHTSVWGSWWKDGTWGYACCHQCVKNSYCTGTTGVAAAQESSELMLANLEAKARDAQAAKEADDQRRRESKLNDYKGYVPGVWGSDGPEDGQELDPEKVKEALKRIEKREREAVDGDAEKRKFNSVDGGSETVTQEEMEAWRLKRSRADDPMAAMAATAAAGGGTGAGGYDLL